MADPEKYWKELSGRLGENIDGYLKEIVELNAAGLRMSKVVEVFAKDIDDLKDKLARAEADGAAMRELLERHERAYVSLRESYYCLHCHAHNDYELNGGHENDCELLAVLKGTAGQALLDKLARYEDVVKAVVEARLDTIRKRDMENGAVRDELYHVAKLASAALGEGGK